MLIRRNPNTRRSAAKRLSLVVPALLCLAPLTMAPAAAATNTTDDEEDCYNLDDECIPFSDITENTKVFLAQAADGSTQGFTDWSDYEDYVEENTDLDIELQDGKVVVNEDDDDPDGVRTAPGASRGGGLPSASGGFALFFAQSNFAGKALLVGAPQFIPDLSKLKFSNTSSWNNRISSVTTLADGVALLCLKKNCAASGPVVIYFTVPGQTQVQLQGGLNNSASAIGVF